MNIVILNGNPDAGNKPFDEYIGSLSRELSGKEHEVYVHLLRNMDIRYCTGCWSCWWKTPGLCAHRDDMPAIYKSIMAADLFFFASPVVMGFMSALLKRANERLIPLIHPYIAMVKGESHHRKRYERYPALGIILGKGPDADDDDIRIISDIYKREALNFKTCLRHTFLTAQPVQEVCNAIDAF